MTTLLILTTGQSDVQLAQGDTRQELDTKTCGELHDQIAQRSWKVVDGPTNKGKERVTELPDGDLELSTPKLDAVLNWYDDVMPTAALIFETRRTFRSDPRYAGTVLARRLQDRGVTNVFRRPILKDEEWLEDPNAPQDAVVRREIVDGVANATANTFAEIIPANVVVASTGGLAAANLVIEELVRLHSVGCAEVQVLEVPDSALVGRNDRAVPERFHPAAGFRARWQALSLIERGNLIAAWGAVSHLEGAPGQDWMQVIKWLSQFASSLPFDPLLPTGCDLAVLSHERMAVRAALRVELALRAEDIPRAVHGTVAFFEAVLWDHLLDRFERTGQRQRGLEELRLKTGIPAPTGKKLLRNEEPEDKKKRNCPFDHLENGTYLFFEDGAGRFARDYVKSEPLKALHDAVAKVKALRNDVAHNEPTPSLMAEAREKMIEAELWSDENKFLTQPLVKNVLDELGVQQSDQLCNNLLSTVRERLLTIT